MRAKRLLMRAESFSEVLETSWTSTVVLLESLSYVQVSSNDQEPISTSSDWEDESTHHDEGDDDDVDIDIEFEVNFDVNDDDDDDVTELWTLPFGHWASFSKQSRWTFPGSTMLFQARKVRVTMSRTGFTYQTRARVYKKMDEKKILNQDKIRRLYIEDQTLSYLQCSSASRTEGL